MEFIVESESEEETTEAVSPGSSNTCDPTEPLCPT